MLNQRNGLARTTICLCLIAALTYLSLWRLWAAAPADRAYLPEKSDLAEVFFPPRYFFAQKLAQGEFALWNPHVYSGYPQFADPQAATFYPPALLLALVEGARYSMQTVAFSIALHYFLAGAFTFLFLRRFVGGHLPPLLGACLFEFGGYLTYYPPLQLSELEVVPWIPLAMLLITIAVERNSLKWMALAGLTFGTVFLAGRPQSYLSGATLALPWFVYFARRQRLPASRIAAMAALFGASALGFAAAQWVPTLELTRLSTRSNLTYALVSEGGFPLDQLPGLLVPQIAGTQNLYTGLVSLSLAAIALTQRKGLLWIAIALASIVVSLGKHLIVFDVLYLVQTLGFPGYMRNVERLAFALSFCLAVLAAIGLKSVQAEVETAFAAWRKPAGGILLACFVIIAMWMAGQRGTQPDALTRAISTASYVVLMLGSALTLFWIWRHRPALLALGLVIIAIVDVMSVNRERFLVKTAFLPGNDTERVAAAPDGRMPVFRTVFDQTSGQDFGSVTLKDNVRGMPPLNLTDYERLLISLDEYRRNRLLNVEVVVTTGVYPDRAFSLAKTVDNFNYYYFNDAKPRMYLSRSVRKVDGPVAAAGTISAPDFDYWNIALVEGETGLTEGGALGPDEFAEIQWRNSGNVMGTVRANERRLLVLADSFYPGWQAYIDGVSVPIHKTNVALRGIVVPPGEHTVLFSYRPASFAFGLALSAFTFALVAGWFAFAVIKRRRITAAPT